MGMARVGLRWLDHRLRPSPTVLAVNGDWNVEALRQEGLDLAEAEMALQEHGPDGVDGSPLVERESDGSIRVVPKQVAGRQRPKRRVRVVRPPRRSAGGRPIRRRPLPPPLGRTRSHGAAGG